MYVFGIIVTIYCENVCKNGFANAIYSSSRLFYLQFMKKKMFYLPYTQSETRFSFSI